MKTKTKVRNITGLPAPLYLYYAEVFDYFSARFPLTWSVSTSLRLPVHKAAGSPMDAWVAGSSLLLPTLKYNQQRHSIKIEHVRSIHETQRSHRTLQTEDLLHPGSAEWGTRETGKDRFNPVRSLACFSCFA